MSKKKTPKQGNAVARDLRSPKYRKRVFRKRKGKASYTRKGRRPGGA